MHEFVFSSVSLKTTTAEKCSECSNTHLQDTVSPDPSQDGKQVCCLTYLYTSKCKFWHFPKLANPFHSAVWSNKTHITVFRENVILPGQFAKNSKNFKLG